MSDDTAQNPYIAATEELLASLDTLAANIDEQLGEQATATLGMITDADEELTDAEGDVEAMAEEANAEIDEAVLDLLSEEG